ncbi:MaoC family dehydratase [Microbacterium ulmi]|uniref:MaoC family dehydratase n=1 Tax=Microbacterium ulmi TaxID=179095 RepID=A0A7Y2M0R2_9MICO|nr:MaoC family dehydratase [Microbacterium ulmi]NII69955.1 acyl dehydratase [Microbacterium ulmi]NNH03874.1 MaoC family dehydratase [Microbacterium ulmi]
MTTTIDIPRYTVGQVLIGPVRTLSLQRVTWYSTGQLGAATGVPHEFQDNIHTNPEYAKEQGLPGMIADGMHSTNWISSLLWDSFGYHYIENGTLRTKFIKPVWVPSPITCKAEVTAVEDDGPQRTRYVLSVWNEDAEGTKLTVGDASVVVDETIADIVRQRAAS